MHARTPPPPVLARPRLGRGRRRQRAGRRGFNFATLSRCDEGSYQNKGLMTGISSGSFLSPLPTLRLILALSSGAAEVSRLLPRIYRELKLSVDRLKHTTYPAAKEFFRSVSCAHTRWKSRASGTSPSREFTCSGEGRPSRFLGSAVSGMTTRLRSSLFPAELVIVFFTASNRHCIERDDYFDKAPC
jgi:hypothetical protein